MKINSIAISVNGSYNGGPLWKAKIKPKLTNLFDLQGKQVDHSVHSRRRWCDNAVLREYVALREYATLQTRLEEPIKIATWIWPKKCLRNKFRA